MANTYRENLFQIFRDSPQQIVDQMRDDFLKETNLYLSKVKTGPEFPKGVGATLKTRKLRSADFIYDAKWYPVEDKECGDDCGAPPPVLSPTAGYQEDVITTYEIPIQSVSICLDKIQMHQNPAQEIQKIRDEFIRNARYVNEEFVRFNYLANCDNRVVSLVAPSALDENGACNCYTKSCVVDHRTQGWQFGVRDNGYIDTRYVYVAVHPSEFPRIAELTLDTLEQAAVELSYADSSKPFLEEGSELLNVILPDYSVTTRFEEYENITTANSIAYGGGYAQLAKRYGVKRVYRDLVAVTYDKFAWRGYPDDEYNNALSAPFDPNDPDTWPRLKRIHPYKEVPIENGKGIKAVPDPAYRQAPFAISTIWNNDVIQIRPGFDNVGLGGASLARPEYNYHGNVIWDNIISRENPNGEKGFWRARFWNGVERLSPEYGYAYLHRLDHRQVIYTNGCAVPSAPCRQRLSNFCWHGLTSGDAALNGSVGSNRGAGPWGLNWG